MMARRCRWVLAGLLLLGAAALAQEECTVAVIAGSATADGRPLLWKNRDSSFRENSAAFFHGPRYDFIGVINSGDTTQVWMGVNTAGFALMNSESMDQDGDSADTEGYFMKQALGECARVEDLDALLRRTALAGRGTRANFGCIDAAGGAAFFEAGNYRHRKFTPQDSGRVPAGLLVRANFSMTGQGGEAYGGWRYHRARALLAGRAAAGKLDLAYMLEKVMRDLVSDDLDPYPLPFRSSTGEAPAGFIHAQNTINRHRTVSAVLFQGVRPGEDPALTTMWILLGEPVAAVALPLWPASGEVPPAYGGAGKSRLNAAFTRLRARLYPDRKRPQYLDTERLAAGRRPWVRERTALESEVLQEAGEAMARWRRQQPAGAEMAALQKKLLNKVIRAL
ncbi:MAG TPA: hypothetical protein PLO28_11240 [bacterium]|nr:hypothetical protein [bacterium]